MMSVPFTTQVTTLPLPVQTQGQQSPDRGLNVRLNIGVGILPLFPACALPPHTADLSFPERLFNFMCMNSWPARVCTVSTCLVSVEGRTPWNGSWDGCMRLHVDPGTRTQVLCKRSKCCKPLSLLSCPILLPLLQAERKPGVAVPSLNPSTQEAQPRGSL